MALRALLLALSLAAITCGALVWFVPLAARGSSHPDLPSSQPAHAQGPPAVSHANLDSLVYSVIARTPFRAARRPATARFGLLAPRGVVDAVAPVPKPALVLSGLVWGAQPVAVIEGFPGAERPKAVRRGEVVGGIKVQRIDRSRVWLSSQDTSWTLRLDERRP